MLNLQFAYRYARKYSKRNKNWTVVPVKEPKKYKYIAELMKNALDALRNHKGPIPRVFPLEDDDPRKIKRTIAELSPPPTKDLVERKKSRFTD